MVGDVMMDGHECPCKHVGSGADPPGSLTKEPMIEERLSRKLSRSVFGSISGLVIGSSPDGCFEWKISKH